MKHIKKKFMFESSIDGFNLSGTEKIGKDEINDKIKAQSNSELKKRQAFIHLDNDKVLGASFHKMGRKMCLVPIPDSTLVYFHSAQLSLRNIEDVKPKLEKKLKQADELKEHVLNELYNYFGASSQLVIMLFTSVESFINSSIKRGYEYKRKVGNKRTELFSILQVQREITFKEKLTKVVPELYPDKLNFFDIHKKEGSAIWNLKEFRNEIVHTKHNAGNIEHYRPYIDRYLSFKYNESLKAVAKLINFYKGEGYIVECDCGEDY